MSSNAQGGAGKGASAPGAASGKPQAGQAFTDWTFGELPELMEIQRGGHTLIGFPALIDKGQSVEIEVFDEPDVAAAKHRAGLRRLVALQIKEPLKYLQKNIPDLQKMAMAYMSLGTADELRDQIIDVALDRAYLADPLPTDAASFKARVEEGRIPLALALKKTEDGAKLCVKSGDTAMGTTGAYKFELKRVVCAIDADYMCAAGLLSVAEKYPDT